MTKVVGMLFVLNEREFIKQELDFILKYVDELIILMGAFPFTFFFSTPQGNSIDGTKEFIEKYITENNLQNKVTFIHSNKWTSFDQMKPRGFQLAAAKNPEWIWEFCCNEFYLEKDAKEIRQKMDNGTLTGELLGVQFKHFFRLLRWAFPMGGECRIFRYRPGRYMQDQSRYNEADGRQIFPTNIPQLCYHFCPAKTGNHPYMYWLKYIGYHVKGRNGNDVRQEDIDWAYRILVDEGHLKPIEDIEKDMVGPIGGAHMATQYYGPWPKEITEHPRFNSEVIDYYKNKGFEYKNDTYEVKK